MNKTLILLLPSPRCAIVEFLSLIRHEQNATNKCREDEQASCVELTISKENRLLVKQCGSEYALKERLTSGDFTKPCGMGGGRK
jgi:hypothetical protein